MTEILYTDVASYLKRIASAVGASLPSTILLYGDELLYKTTLQSVLNTLLPPEKQAFNYETIDGVSENVYPAIEKLTTYSFFADPKVIGFVDTRIFHGKKNADEIFLKIKTAYEENDVKSASRNFFSLLSVMSLTIEDVRDKNYTALKLNPEMSQNTAWMDSLVECCIENPVSESSGNDSAQILQRAIEHGFVPEAHLILTTDMVDKRKGLYKTIAEKGLVIDCSTPTAESGANRKIQAAFLWEQVKLILTPLGKTLDKDVFQQLVDITGFDLRTFAGNLQKLAQYVGERKVITSGDVQSVISRTRRDPIYEMTTAVMERKPESALFYLRSLLSGGFFPLQIVAAITKQIRKLLILKDVLETPAFRFWKAGCHYDQFSRQFAQTILPALQSQDATLLERLDTWKYGDASTDTATSGKQKKKSSSSATDLLISKQSNAYAVYKQMEHASRFSRQELVEAVGHLYRASVHLTSSRMNPSLILETMILNICRASTGAPPP